MIVVAYISITFLKTIFAHAYIVTVYCLALATITKKHRIAPGAKLVCNRFGTLNTLLPEEQERIIGSSHHD